jgi:hypothetical protein
MPSPYRQCRLGADLSSGTLLYILPPNISSHSLAKLIARDGAMSTLNALINHLIKGKQRRYARLIWWINSLSSFVQCKFYFPREFIKR